MENNEKNLNEPETESTVDEETVNESENTEGEGDVQADEDGELEALRTSLDEAKDRTLRLVAEFDNFKKRTLKEKEELYSTAVCETVNEFLPIIDNLKRAIDTADGADVNSVLNGVKMILKQFEDTLSSIGVEEIETDNGFDPELHNAVMHVEDDNYGEGEIAEELMRGYRYKGRVIRHSMVKVAN